MASFEIEDRRPDGGGGGGGTFGDGGPVPAPATPAAPAPAAPAAAPAAPTFDPNSPEFRALPRELQKQVEAGGNLAAIYKQFDAAGGANAGPGNSPQPVTQPTTGGPAPVANPQPITQPRVIPTGLGGGAGLSENRLSAGEALQGGRLGEDTFARRGGGGYDAFRGQDFGTNLAGGQAFNKLSALDALRFGNQGRQLLQGGGFGASGASLDNSGSGANPFLNDLLG